MSDYFTTSEAIDYIQKSRSTLYRHARPIHSGSGSLPATWHKDDLDKIINRYMLRG